MSKSTYPATYKIVMKNQNKAVVKMYSPDKIGTVVFNSIEGESQQLAEEYVAFKTIGKSVVIGDTHIHVRQTGN